MAKESLSFAEAKKIPITEFLSGSGINPVKIRGNDYWYHSPFRTETNPSFKVDNLKNLWYDHGSGEGGTLIDLGAKLHQCSIKEFVEMISENQYHHLKNFSFHQPSNHQPKNNLEVVATKELTSLELINYLNSRGIQTDLARKYCKEVEFQIGSRRYQAIGFENRSFGFELRNPWFKGSSSPKDITLINNHAPKLCILEGFMDFLSLQQINNGKIKTTADQSDFLILNSLSFLNRNIQLIQNYKDVVLFLDNDLPGKEAKEGLSKNGFQFQDASRFYSKQKDLNDYLVEELKEKMIKISNKRKKGLRF